MAGFDADQYKDVANSHNKATGIQHMIIAKLPSYLCKVNGSLQAAIEGPNKK